MCQLADMLYFEHPYKFRTILYSVESKNHTKLWIHGNWGHDSTLKVSFSNVNSCDPYCVFKVPLIGYWSFQNDFALDFTHFQGSNSK